MRATAIGLTVAWAIMIGGYLVARRRRRQADAVTTMDRIRAIAEKKL